MTAKLVTAAVPLVSIWLSMVWCADRMAYEQRQALRLYSCWDDMRNSALQLAFIFPAMTLPATWGL
jgi:hypothetical protein